VIGENRWEEEWAGVQRENRVRGRYGLNNFKEGNSDGQTVDPLLDVVSQRFQKRRDDGCPQVGMFGGYRGSRIRFIGGAEFDATFIP
jgi:hypothetical protein